MKLRLHLAILAIGISVFSTTPSVTMAQEFRRGDVMNTKDRLTKQPKLWLALIHSPRIAVPGPAIGTHLARNPYVSVKLNRKRYLYTVSWNSKQVSQNEVTAFVSQICQLQDSSVASFTRLTRANANLQRFSFQCVAK